MSLIKVSDNIYQLSSWMFMPMNIWLVKEEDGIVLIDTGLPMISKKVLSAIKQLNAGPLKRILLTHGHGDHVGGLNNILAEYDVPVYAHTIEIPFADGTYPYPGRKKSQSSIKNNILQSLPVDNKGNLTRLGALTPYHTPGHTPGHTAYYHEKDGVVLCGDMFTNKRGKPSKPISFFTSNMEQAEASGNMILSVKPKVICITHGKMMKM